jgi:hypothetical protein
MVTRLQTVTPVALGKENWLRTTFASDDDFVLPVSIYLDSSKGAAEITENVAEVLRAYGFTNIPRVYQAPGSFYIHIEKRFGSKDRQAARQCKKELKTDLLSEKPPKNPKRRRAVKELKGSLLRRAQKKLRTAVLLGVVLLGGVLGDVFKDALKDEIETLAREHGPKVAQELDQWVARELPSDVAAKIHALVREYVERSPNKLELPPPPEKRIKIAGGRG